MGVGAGAEDKSGSESGKGRVGWGRAHLRLPLQPAVPRAVRRQGPLCHRSMPEVVIVAEDLQQSRETELGFPSVSPPGRERMGVDDRLLTGGSRQQGLVGHLLPAQDPARRGRGPRGTPSPWDTGPLHTTYVGSPRAGRATAPISLLLPR